MNIYKKSERFGLLLIILILLPIDWFSPTGLLLREAGAKPLNVILPLVLIGMFLLRRNIFKVGAILPVQAIYMAIIISGSLAFLLNVVILPSPVPSERTPIIQFITQTGMLILFMINLQALSGLFSNDSWRQKVIEYLPTAATLHFGVFLLEALDTFEQHGSLLSFFRNEFGLIDRASGFMSEPSYYGTFAALYAMPILLLSQRNVFLTSILALALIISAILVYAKTMFLVLGAQIAYLLIAHRNHPRIKKLLWTIIVATVAAATYIGISAKALDLGENLSSIMRLGSNLLAWRVATEGYGIVGIGIGQFHFFYRNEFAPEFLFLSHEALMQFSGESGVRASTYNMPVRLLVEAGILGLLLFLGLVLFVIKKTRRSTDTATITGMLFLFGSLGFLMTQDTYCLPSLAFGLALALSEPRENVAN